MVSEYALVVESGPTDGDITMRTLDSGSSCIAILTVILRLSSRKSIVSARRIERDLGTALWDGSAWRCRIARRAARCCANVFAEGDVYFPRISIND